MAMSGCSGASSSYINHETKMLRELCQEHNIRFSITDSNSKLASKLAQYTNRTKSSDRKSVKKQSAQLNSQIADIQNEIRRLELANLEREISILHSRHVKPGTPGLEQNSDAAHVMHDVVANSDEPFVTRRRKPRSIRTKSIHVDADNTSLYTSQADIPSASVVNSIETLGSECNNVHCLTNEQAGAYANTQFNDVCRRYDSLSENTLGVDHESLCTIPNIHDDDDIDPLLMSLLPPPVGFEDDNSVSDDCMLINHDDDLHKVVPDYSFKPLVTTHSHCDKATTTIKPAVVPPDQIQIKASPAHDDSSTKQANTMQPQIPIKESPTQDRFVPNTTATIPCKELSPHDSQNASFYTTALNMIERNTITLAQSMHAMKLPQPVPTVFAGDPLEYHDWSISFQRFIETNISVTPSQKLWYLKQYTAGEVLSVVNGYYATDSDDAYDTVRGIIHERYGNEYLVSQAFQSKLASWPQIPSDDPKALQRFVDFLKSVQTAMSTIPHLSFLNHQQENAKLKQLLPLWLKRKWNNHAVDLTTSSSATFPGFTVFVEFLSGQCKKVNHPIATDVTNLGVKKAHAGMKSQQYVTHSTNISSSNPSDQTAVPPDTSKSDSVMKSPCAICNEDHKLYKCKEFKMKSAKQRHDHVIKHKLCVKCLNSHPTKPVCTLNISCRACGKDSGHNHLLHDALVRTNTEQSVTHVVHNTGTVKTTRCPLTSKSSYVLPVYVSHESDPDHEVLTYAMLDNQSNITFMTDDIACEVTKPNSATTLPISTMTGVNKPVRCNVYSHIVVRGYGCDERLSLDTLYGCDAVPNNQTVPSADDISRWDHLSHVAKEFPPLFDCGVGMLIGSDYHYAMFPKESVPPRSRSDPYIVRTPLGLCFVGPVDRQDSSCNFVAQSHMVSLADSTMNHGTLTETDVSSCGTTDGCPLVTVNTTQANSPVTLTGNAVPMDVVRQLESGFDLPGDDDRVTYSMKDLEFLDLMRDSICQDNSGLYSMPLPFSGGNPPVFPNNRSQAVSRLKSLNSKFKDPAIFTKYNQFVVDLVASGDAEAVPLDELNVGNKWYLPHHNVVNPKKPDKFRVVFDGSCKFKGASLNQSLLTGPDLNNSLVGVLIRFRENKVAIACDIQSMFYRFKVHKQHRDFLRFLWYDKDRNIIEYRMTKHIFGASSSPACSKYGLRQLADDYGGDFPLAKWFIQRCFYVDDGLYSCPTPQDATNLLQQSIQVCGSAGLKVHKVLSNDKAVLSSFPEESLGCDIKQFEGGVSGSERALGIDWSPVSDNFSFTYCHMDKSNDKLTRRRMLSHASSMFDPLGFIAPIILKSKLMLQRNCHGVEWDSILPTEVEDEWRSWTKDLKNLELVQIPRCVKPWSNDEISRSEVHTFTDACETGYGCCVYLRVVTKNGSATCRLLAAKSRVVPLKGSTIPRLELQAAMLGAEMGTMVVNELSCEVDNSFFWTDSEVVLAYLNNQTKKLKTFMRNRVRSIKELTSTDQWRYVATHDNPADLASRGSDVSQLTSSNWFEGPDFLRDANYDASKSEINLFTIPDGDSEVQKLQIAAHVSLMTTTDSLNSLLNAVQKCHSLKSAISIASLVNHTLKSRWKSAYQHNIDTLKAGEEFLIKQTQSQYFPNEISGLQSGRSVSSQSSISSLNPYLDHRGIMRVGGRLGLSSKYSEEEKHPVLIPKNSHITTLIVRHYHEKCAHQGRSLTMSCVRSAGYWVVNLPSVVRKYLSSCVTCRKLRRSTETQKMSELPTERIEPAPPFTDVGVDYFGPFEVKDGRRICKRYGVLFTCLYSRAVHVEMCDDLTSDGFINSLRTFMAIRGPVRQIFCDRGSNLVGAASELSNALLSLDDSPLKQFLLDHNCEFNFNSPSASHMGGSWERQIKTVRNVFDGLISKAVVLDSSSLRTVFYECMNIVNNRPLGIIESSGDLPITPNTLIHMKSSLAPPPPGIFPSDNQYSRKRWLKVQAIADMFWKSWKSEYISSLQERQRWHAIENYHVDDIVLLKDEQVCRGQWQLGRIAELIQSRDGLVRRVKLQVGDNSTGLQIRPRYLERPVQKLVMLIPRSDA